MVKKSNKTIQLGLRVDVQLVEKIEKSAEIEGIDKMSWIRRALATFVNGEEKGASDEAIEDYIHLRIDEDRLKEIMGLKTVPKDISSARQNVVL